MTTRFRANPAVIVHVAVTVTFFAAQLACQYAGVQLGVDKSVRCFSLPHQHPAGRVANVRTVEISADTPAELFEMLGLAEARVGTRGAGRSTRCERLERFHVVVGVLGIGPRVATKHHVDCFHEKGIQGRGSANLVPDQDRRYGAQTSPGHREKSPVDAQWLSPGPARS
jgi:hypothetical protein